MPELYIFTKEMIDARDNLQKALCLAAAENQNDIEGSFAAITNAPSPELPAATHIPSEEELKSQSYIATDKSRPGAVANMIDSFSWRQGAKFVTDLLTPPFDKDNWCICLTPGNRAEVLNYTNNRISEHIVRNAGIDGNYYGIRNGHTNGNVEPFAPTITYGQFKMLLK